METSVFELALVYGFTEAALTFAAYLLMTRVFDKKILVIDLENLLTLPGAVQFYLICVACSLFISGIAAILTVRFFELN